MQPDGDAIKLAASAEKLTPGLYVAIVSVTAPGAAVARQQFRVVLDVRQDRPPLEVVVDNTGPGFYATPFFWTGHRFKFWRDKGYRDFYLTNGGRSEPAEFARFTPNLRGGKYEVTFTDETPFKLYPGSRFQVVVKHRIGTKELWVEPDASRLIGTFEFTDGTDGYVEIRAGGAQGHVVVDAVRFRPVK